MNELFLLISLLNIPECRVIAEHQRQTVYLVEEDTGLLCMAQGVRVNYTMEARGYTRIGAVRVGEER